MSDSPLPLSNSALLLFPQIRSIGMCQSGCRCQIGPDRADSDFCLYINRYMVLVIRNPYGHGILRLKHLSLNEFRAQFDTTVTVSVFQRNGFFPHISQVEVKLLSVIIIYNGKWNGLP